MTRHGWAVLSAERCRAVPSPIENKTIIFQVYTECRRSLLEDALVYDRSHIPDLRDVQRVIGGCSALPKEAAENKKLFTRLWVHETLRNFFDRLMVPKDMDAVFQCMRQCVKTIFRENFDSAFEHLGKVDGQVTQLNLRNLLFGKYLSLPAANETAADKASNNPSFVEVTGFDQVEKAVVTRVKQNNQQKGYEESSLIPIRYSQLSFFVFVMMGHVAAWLCSAHRRAVPCRAITRSKQINFRINP